jgi:ATP:corrinoid adenosyltransferase
MSEQVMYTGKIKKVDTGIGTFESFMEAVIKEKSMWNEYLERKNKYSETIEEFFLEEFYEKYVMISDELYEILTHEFYDTEDIFKAIDNKDGTYDFVVSFYNGGCSFNEAIEEALKGVVVFE